MKKFNTKIHETPAGQDCYEVYEIGKKKELGRYYGTSESEALECYGLLVDANKERVLYRNGESIMRYQII